MTDLSGGNPRGLRFVVDVANAYRGNPDLTVDEFGELVDRHGASDTDRPHFGTVVDLGELHAVLTDITAVLTTGVPDTAAALINTILARNPCRPHLVQLPGRPWSMYLRTDTTHPVRWFAATSAFALGLWLSEKGACAWGVCAAPGCHRFFIDTGRRAPQRYCTPRCATRVRVAHHRHQHSAR